MRLRQPDLTAAGRQAEERRTLSIDRELQSVETMINIEVAELRRKREARVPAHSPALTPRGTVDSAPAEGRACLQDQGAMLEFMRGAEGHEMGYTPAAVREQQAAISAIDLAISQVSLAHPLPRAPQRCAYCYCRAPMRILPRPLYRARAGSQSSAVRSRPRRSRMWRRRW
jgi:hypothetical protein